jgi:hypothetical protein
MSQRYFFLLGFLPGVVALRLGGSDFFVLGVLPYRLGGSNSTVRSIASASASGCVNRRCSSSSLKGLASFKKVVDDTEGHASFTNVGDGDMLE